MHLSSFGRLPVFYICPALLAVSHCLLSSFFACYVPEHFQNQRQVGLSFSALCHISHFSGSQFLQCGLHSLCRLIHRNHIVLSLSSHYILPHVCVCCFLLQWSPSFIVKIRLVSHMLSCKWILFPYHHFYPVGPGFPPQSLVTGTRRAECKKINFNWNFLEISDKIIGVCINILLAETNLWLPQYETFFHNSRLWKPKLQKRTQLCASTCFHLFLRYNKK